MAYSDYGGYAYRNGRRVDDRSDATITPEGDTYGTPGSYPGFALLAAGVPHAEVMQRIEWPSGHAVLGDGPVYLVLRKTYATIYRGAEKQELPIDRDDYEADEVRRTVDLDGCKVELVYTHEDNYYVYARLTQPDGNVWHGWSGYGVGAGLEDADYGFSTRAREDKLMELWPESIAALAARMLDERKRCGASPVDVSVERPAPERGLLHPDLTRTLETRRGTRYEVLEWTCPRCRQRRSTLYIDGESYHIAFAKGPNGAPDEKCGTCWRAEVNASSERSSMTPNVALSGGPLGDDEASLPQGRPLECGVVLHPSEARR